MKKLILLFILFLFSENLNASSITGNELKKKIAIWLESKGAKPNIEILDDIKYPNCNDDDLLMSDISGNFRLIKVSCLGENKWSFI